MTLIEPREAFEIAALRSLERSFCFVSTRDVTRLILIEIRFSASFTLVLRTWLWACGEPWLC